MAQKEPKSWITVNGKHIPIFDDEGSTEKENDLYFKKDWPEGTGPNSASFKEALSWAKRKVDKEAYSFNETVEAAQAEYYLNDDEALVLGDKLKMYAINNNCYLNRHSQWKEDFERRGIEIRKRKTKIEKELED